MRKCFAILSLVFCLACAAAEKPKPAHEKSAVSKHDQKLAEKEFKNALELQKSGRPEEALLSATKASQLVPGNMEYITVAEMLRQQIVGTHLDKGNQLAAAGDAGGAIKEFRTAQGIDPQNAYVDQRLRDVTPTDPDADHARTIQLLASVDQIDLKPTAGKKSFHVQGDTRQVYTLIGAAFGISIQFDQGLNTRSLRF